MVVRAGKYDEELMATAKKLASPGRGLLAIDESNATAGKRLDSIGGERIFCGCGSLYVRLAARAAIKSGGLTVLRCCST